MSGFHVLNEQNQKSLLKVHGTSENIELIEVKR